MSVPLDPDPALQQYAHPEKLVTTQWLEDNLGAEGWRLSPEHEQALDKASRKPPPYPHDMYRFINSL